MEHLGQENMKQNIAAKIMHETRRLNNLFASKQEPSAEDVESMALEDFQEAFSEFGDDFLSDELANRVLDSLKVNYDSLKEYYPEGTKILIAAFPCNINGTIFSDEDMKEGKYLTALTLDEATGLNLGFGAITPSTHAKMLPQEIQDNCTFTVHYDTDTTWADKNDFKKFSEQYKKAYKKLRYLLKPELKSK